MGEETRDIGTRDKAETGRQAASTRNDREAGASTPLRSGGPGRVLLSSDDESEYELIVIDGSPENSPEKRDRPRQSPRDGGRSRSRVVVLNEKKDFQAVASRVEEKAKSRAVEDR